MQEFYFILIYLVVYFLLTFSRTVVKNWKDTDFLYTALGDELSNSFITFLLQGYAYRVNRHLKLKYSHVIFNNLARPKFTTTDLLMQLRNNNEIRQSIKRSNIITISIGANNLMPAVIEDYSEIYGVLARKGVEQFKEDWPLILHFIRNCIGSKAKIYIMTIYNPYEFCEPNYSIADYYINGINSIIKDKFWMNSYGYEIVDIYENFKDSSNKLTLFESPIRKPYPNYEGYKQIAKNFISSINS